MLSMNKSGQPATRDDVKQIVTEATRQILNAVGNQFDVVNNSLDGIDNQLEIIGTDASHARNISQATSDRADHLEKRVKHLETKPA